MDPPRRLPSARRAAASQKATATSNKSNPASSTFPPNINRTNMAHESKGSRPAGLEWEESETRLQIGVAECIETKTVTTTTTTKRQYPPLNIRPPRSLRSLNSKEYPLATQPTPHELMNFSYMVGDAVVHFQEDGPSTPKSMVQAQDQGSFATPSSRKVTRELRVAHDPNDIFIRNHSNLSTSSDPSDSFEGNRHRLSHPHRSLSRQCMQDDAPSGLNSPKSALLSRSKQSASRSSQNNRTADGSSNTTEPRPDVFAFEDAPSPSVIAAQASFPGAVATPPITDADLEPFDQLSRAFNGAGASRTSSNTSGIQSASLPSPSLSPTLAAANLHHARFPVSDEDDTSDTISAAFSGDSLEENSVSAGLWGADGPLIMSEQRADRWIEGSSGATVMETRSMIDAFDSMSDEMKTFMMYQFLRRCPRKTLHTIAGIVNPALKCDFLEQLPPELSLHILSFLHHRDLCRAAQVSKRWRNIIDSNETGWKELFDRDKHVLPAGELERAIIQGWGWQDPYGVEGWERDLSPRPQTSDGDPGNGSSSSRLITDGQHNSSRSSIKRKRALGSLGIDRSKRQALSYEATEKLRQANPRSTSLAANKISKSEGPNAAATAAALAVPNPRLGLPSLSKLHLFKSLYRRHHMLQQNWMSGKVKPHHMAFPAHPRHVITCLQFDDDKILTGSDDTYIHVYDTKTGKLRKRLEGHEGGVWALQYEGNILVSGSTDRSVRVWDIERGLCTQVFQGHTSTVRCLQILMPVDTGKVVAGKPVMVPEKPLIITGSRDSQLRVWRLPEQGGKRFMQISGTPDTDCPYFIRVLQGHNHSVRAIAAHEDTLVSGSYDHSVRVWKISTGETVHLLRGHEQKVYSVVLDNTRKRCISGSMDNTVKIWSLDTGSCLFTLIGHSSLVGLLDLKEDRLVSAAADSTLRIWDPETGSCKATLSAHTGAITCFQHDGTKVVSGSDRTLKMWNVRTGECLQDLLTDLSGVWQVKFDDRRCVAAVQRDGLTYIEVIDFGASRDGIPASERGRRILQAPSDVDRIVDDDDFVA
ncbi:MAG: SCF ubiquitin ligase complex subunit cdc4 [Claussenomyces sp. TS43310]|nr:MAG: SCF ubiquitin ligase complex subunit cdc4 [Claussenomyces sp. TS43310]